jgi:hypothetical protein
MTNSHVPTSGDAVVTSPDDADGDERGRNILIVSTVEHPEAVLRRHVGPHDSIKVVVPVVRQGVLDWLANDERAFARAQEVAEETGTNLPAEAVETGAGEANVDLAVRDALATFPAQEVLMVVHVENEQGVIESSAMYDVRGGRAINGVPVRLIAVSTD